MELYDKFVISSYEPQSSRVLWIDADKHEIKAFINGKWESCGGGGGSVPELVEEVNRILSYIPAQASEDNKLTDTNFVNNNFIRSEVVRNIVTLTQAQYDALITKDANTEYNIIESV